MFVWYLQQEKEIYPNCPLGEFSDIVLIWHTCGSRMGDQYALFVKCFYSFFRNAHRFGNSSVLFSLVLPLGIFLSLCCLSFCVPPMMSPAFGVHAIMFAHSLVAFLCSMSCSQRRASTKIAQSWYSNYLFWSLSKHACVHNLNMFVSPHVA